MMGTQTDRQSLARNALVGALIVAAIVSVAFRTETVRVYEDVAFALDPTPERAFAYGSQHFDAQRPESYDLGRAERFFTRALALDPQYPYLQHQLARLAFLDGNFPIALARINLQISLYGTSTPNSYYVRGLIKGFAGDYAGAAADYETYLRTDPKNWAAITDYSWVLIKDTRYKEALVALDWGLIYWPENPWLHNTRATALFELGHLEEAREAAEAASRAVEGLTEEAWLQAYPGNDPLIAPQGIAAFKKAVEANMHTIRAVLEDGAKTVQ